MEITSDDDGDGDGFQELGDSGPQPSRGEVEVQQSTIRPFKPRRNFRLELVEQESLQDISIVESQYYILNVYLNGELIRGEIRRRFSDFDILFEKLFRVHKGYILPAFPEKGLMSYVKTKVSLTKDRDFLQQRMYMLQRFLTILLNDPTFDMQTNREMSRFLSEKEFDLFKKQEKQNSQGIVASSLNRLWSLVSFGKENKYKAITEQLHENKKSFEKLYACVKEIRELLLSERNEYLRFIEKQFGFANNAEYCRMIKKSQEAQESNLEEARKLEFDLLCLNEDFSMVLKTIENIEDMRKNEQNYRDLEQAERVFATSFNNFHKNKGKELVEATNKFREVLETIKAIDQTL